MESITNPVILFFIFGVLAGLIKSNLEVPQQLAKFLSLYLLMAIGLKGGSSLAESGLTFEVGKAMMVGVGLSLLVPIVSYRFLRRYLNGFDAVSVAATYGSISAVTFVTAAQFLTAAKIPHDGYMSAVMALMEAPAILIAILAANRLRNNASTNIGLALKETLTEGASLLLLASLMIGIIAGPSGAEVMQPFVSDLFTGLLAFFLLDMGLQVAKNIPQLKDKSLILLVYGIIAPVLHASIALSACVLLDISFGNAVLLMVLAASASYIAVPAALSQSVPEASPSVYLGLSLGITFPFNVILGIPIYHAAAKYFL
jgi:uncharacterized protein